MQFCQLDNCIYPSKWVDNRPPDFVILHIRPCLPTISLCRYRQRWLPLHIIINSLPFTIYHLLVQKNKYTCASPTSCLPLCTIIWMCVYNIYRYLFQLVFSFNFYMYIYIECIQICAICVYICIRSLSVGCLQLLQ